MTLLALLALGSLQAQLWQETYPMARDLAQGSGRPLMLVFSGSDWCAPCIRMKRQVWDSPEFTAYAAERLVLYQADFPKKKQNRLEPEIVAMNRSLAEKYNPRGYFPLVVLLNGEGEVLWETGYNPRYGPKKYIELFNKHVP